MARRLFTLLATTIFVINSVQAAPLRRRDYSGQGTFFTPGLGACGGYNSADDLICAMNKPQFDDGGNPNNNPMC
ncbi:6656_t:CDS:2, partial [Paraglomus occultum]